MSLNKRKKVEEYHDPDYCQAETKKPKTYETDTDRNEKIKAIIKREFLKEINAKQEGLSLIDHKLTQTKRLLQRVRYAIVLSYYTKKNLEFPVNEVKNNLNTVDEILSNLGQQTAIHPSLKKLLGKKPIDYEEILKSRSPRKAAKVARNTLIKPKKDDKKKAENIETINETKVPRYVSPIKTVVPIEKINSARGRNQTSHLIVVGNTSKYIGDEKSVNEVTHKWLVYIKTKTAVAIEDMVSKVRFFLHPSYKPNDVIEVDSPPFQISRRGWGEFPIRIQLYFHQKINQKPLQIYHNLILDKKMTGIQTMGAETTVEVWLDLPIPTSKPIEKEKFARELVPKSVSNNIKKTTDTSLRKYYEKNVDVDESVVAPIRIKKEDDLIINDCTEMQSQEVTSENNEKPTNLDNVSNLNKLGKSQTTSQGCLNEMSDIFKDASPVQTASTVKKTADITKITPVPQKKTFIRCLDNNGKITFVELQVDPNNPKNLKIIKKPNVVVASQLNASNQSKEKNTLLKSNCSLQVAPARSINVPNVLSSASNSSVRTGQYIRADAINKTLDKQKPLIVQSSLSFPQSDSTKTQPLSQEKKLFIIKSANRLNVNSTNPPPLVRISNSTNTPSNIASSNVQTDKPFENRKLTINSNSVIMKNGKIIILDSDKSHLKPKQESLLKPQVSLLKPRFNKSVSESTTAANSITTPYNQGFRQLRKPLKQIITHRNYHKEFCLAFLRRHFQSVQSAVEYLLRNASLINILSNKTDFSAAFPFVVDSQQRFNEFSLPKRRSNEWYRAKWITRMLAQHPDVKCQPCWLPKEIIIFSRKFGYSPAITKNIGDNLEIQNNQNPLMDMIKRYIKDKELKNVTITFDNRMNDFIQRYNDLTNRDLLATDNTSECIDVIGGILPMKSKLKTEPLEGNHQEFTLDVTKIMQTGSMLVTDICRDIEIKLHPEEIVEGVLCASSQLMLWQAMRSFIEDLIRRSFASKSAATQISDLSTESSVQLDDLKKAISTTDHFNFLTNKHLGRKVNTNS